MNVQTLTYHPAPSKPAFQMPAGACDTHCHVFGPQSRFPYPANSTFRPADAPKEKLFALHAMLGIERCVIVQSGCHGFDNSVVADALADKGGRYLGVALLPADVPDAELRCHDAQGFRAVRFNFMKHLGKAAPVDDILKLAGRLGDIGWHLQVHMEAELIEDLAPALQRSPVPVVIDHMGRIDASLGMEQKPFAALLRLMEDEKFLVKVSCSERSSRQDWPHVDATPFARRLVADFPDRVLWGTDWPHPNFRADPPDDGKLADLLPVIAPTAAARRALLVDNPLRFYRFAT